MADVFDGLLGQERAVVALRHHVAHPVHAYLFTGPAGSGMNEALVAFIAALQCPQRGCGVCEMCRLVQVGEDSDVTFVEREGVQWSVREFSEAERISRRKPLGAGHQIVVMTNIELATNAAGKLLKILEEPPSRTIFLLTAEALPDSLSTIASRCVEVTFQPLSEDVVTEYLVRQGFDPLAARAASSAASGDLRRAQVLVRDDALASRIAMWQSIPDRLNPVSALTCQIVEQLTSSIDAALAPLTTMQDEELSRLTDNAKSLGLRGVSGKRDIDARFKREQRRFRQEDLRFGLSALTNVYRERMIEGLEGIDDGDRRSRSTVTGAIHAIELINVASRQLASNIDESLLLTDLLLSLARC